MTTRHRRPAQQAPDDDPATISVPRRTVVALATAVSVVGGFPVLRWLADRDLVTGSPWVLAPLLPLIFLSGSQTVQSRLGDGRLDTRPLPRLIIAFGLFAAYGWIAGWSMVVPASGVFVAVVHVQRSGSQVWRVAAACVTAFTVAGQVGVAVGWVPTVVDPVVSHLGALWILTLAVLGIAKVGTSVAARERSEQALARTEARMRALMDSSTDVLAVSDAAGRLTYVSPAVERSMGYQPQALLGRRLLDLVDPEQVGVVRERLDTVVAEGREARTSLDVLVVLASHERRWYEWTVHNLLEDPLVEGLVVDQRDVTERLLHHEALAHAAAHDDLTGLPNRAELMRRLTAVLPEAAPGAAVAVLFIDLDHFKAVNDSYGHATGDDLLVVVARRLAGCLRAHDHLARLGGDEFCAILTEARGEAEVGSIVARLEAAVSRPVQLGEVVVTVGASIGAALATDGHHNPAALFAEADAAMYRTKRARRTARGEDEVLPEDDRRRA